MRNLNDTDVDFYVIMASCFGLGFITAMLIFA
jgi:hypothetical protein